MAKMGKRARKRARRHPRGLFNKPMEPFYSTARRRSLHLVIKGSKKQAQRELARRGLTGTCVATRGARDASCSVPCGRLAGNYRAMRSIVDWFGEKSTKRKGRGLAPGALLHWAGDCGLEERGSGRFLAGLPKRRRRRRRHG